MTTILIIFTICMYALGAYFFLYQKNRCGTTSLRFRASLFVFSPFLVPFFLWDVYTTWLMGIIKVEEEKK